MGTRHSVRSVPDSSLHVDRSVLHRCTISLSQRAGIIDLCQARCRRDPFRRNLFPTFSFALRFPTTTRKRLDRCNLRLVSGNGRALQSFPVTARRAFLIGAMVWFALIALSPVLTYQHHIIDIGAGFVLAGYCFYFFRESPAKLPVIKNQRVGFYYSAAAIFLFAFAPIFWPLSALVFWPSLSLGIVAGAYFGRGPRTFRKTNGTLPWSARFVLGPCLLGQYLSLLHYRRRCRPWDEVIPNIWIGRKLSNREARGAVRSGVTAVLDLSAEFSEARAFRVINYRNIPILDLTAPSVEQLWEMGGFIAEHSETGIVFVHCKIGYSRSAAAVAAYLIMSGKASNAEEAITMIRRARPSIVIRPEIVS